MNGFHDFDDFRVSAWMNEGVMITLASTAMSVSKSVKQAVATVAAGIVVATSLVATAPATASVPTSDQPTIVFTVDDGDLLEYELALLSHQIDAELDGLLAFSGDGVDESSLALAEKAIESLALRNGSVDADWSKRMFPA